MSAKPTTRACTQYRRRNLSSRLKLFDSLLVDPDSVSPDSPEVDYNTIKPAKLGLPNTRKTGVALGIGGCLRAKAGCTG